MRLATILHVLAGTAALAACNEEPHAPFAPPAQVGWLRFVHASPDTVNAKTVNVRIDGVPLAANVAYKGVAGYALAVAGDRLLSVRKSADTSVVLFDQSVTVTTGRSITVFATGIGTDVAALVLPDDDRIPINGAIRVLNASPTMGPADVYITDPGADLSTATPVASNLAFRAIAGTASSSGGQVRFTTPGTITVVLTGPTLTLTSGQIRTVVALDALGGGTPLTTATLVDRSVVGR